MFEIVTAITESDLRRWNVVRNAAEPHEGMIDDVFLARAKRPGERLHLMSVAPDGTVVAVGQSGALERSGRAGIDVLVSPDADRSFSELATPLVDAMEVWATSHPYVRKLTSYAYDFNPDQCAFWTERGWQTGSSSIVVGVDPRAVDLPELRADLEIVTLADRPELFPAVHEVHNESWFSTPHATAGEELTYERWKANFDIWPGSAPDQFLVAVDGDEVLGYAELDYGGSGRRDDLWHAYSGVRPEHQGRGIGTELKVRSILWASEHHASRLLASNDEANAAMRSINARFGYERQFAYVGFRRTLDARALGD